jgi:hypothetical protein
MISLPLWLLEIAPFFEVVPGLYISNWNKILSYFELPYFDLPKILTRGK